MAIDQDGRSSYYSVLGVGPASSPSEIRYAYRKLAMLWHPDKCHGLDTAKVDLAKKNFQEIQEAYHVLSDDGKRAFYDLRLCDPAVSDSEGLHEFVGELSSMMADVRTQKQEQNNSFQDLQRTFLDMFRADLKMWGLDFTLEGVQREKKRTWEASSQCQQDSVKLQRRFSSQMSTGSCKRVTTNSSFTMSKRPVRALSKTVSDLPSYNKDSCCFVRCYVNPSFNSGIGFM